MVLLILSFAMHILDSDLTADMLSDNNSFSSILNFSSRYTYIVVYIFLRAQTYYRRLVFVRFSSKNLAYDYCFFIYDCEL